MSAFGTLQARATSLSPRNRIRLGNLEVGGDYAYFRLAQVTGAFRANSGRFVIEYRL